MLFFFNLVGPHPILGVAIETPSPSFPLLPLIEFTAFNYFILNVKMKTANIDSKYKQTVMWNTKERTINFII